MRSILVWAMWISWGNFFIWSHGAKPESWSVLLETHQRETVHDSVHRLCWKAAEKRTCSHGAGGGGTDKAHGKEWPTFLTHLAGPLVFPTKQVRKCALLRLTPEAAPGNVFRLGPQSLMLGLPFVSNLLLI